MAVGFVLLPLKLEKKPSKGSHWEYRNGRTKMGIEFDVLKVVVMMKLI